MKRCLITLFMDAFHVYGDAFLVDGCEEVVVVTFMRSAWKDVDASFFH